MGALCKHSQCRRCFPAIAVGTEAVEGAGQAGGKLLLRALPVKRSGLRCEERKRQTLRCGPGAEVTPLGCGRACTCWHEASVTLAHCVARASMFIPPLSETQNTAIFVVGLSVSPCTAGTAVKSNPRDSVLPLVLMRGTRKDQISYTLGFQSVLREFRHPSCKWETP